MLAHDTYLTNASNRAHVVVVATFNDGTTQVIYDSVV
jgi:hypothetical protein